MTNTAERTTVRRWLSVLVAATLLAGCAGPPWKMPALKNEVPAPKQVPQAHQTRVRAGGGDGFALGDVDQPACTPAQFLQRAAELLRAGQVVSADRYVERYPDIALAVLREPAGVPAPPEILARVAQRHDQQCSRVAPNAGWTALLADRAARPEVYTPYDEKRRQFMSCLQNGNARECLAMGVLEAPAGAPGTMLSIDALRLAGIAQVLDGQARSAAATLEKAVGLALRDHPYQAVSLLLLLSDAQRRSEDSARAELSWNQAALLAGELLDGRPPVVDPILWERVAYLRPVNCAWPPEVRRRLAEVNTAFAIVPDPRQAVSPGGVSALEEAPLWIAIGHWRLARDEAQAALVALKRAESSTVDNYIGQRLQLAQARSLAHLGQPGPATAIAIRLAGENDPRISRPAIAMAGALKLQQGGVQQGFNLLRHGVEEEPACQWPERAEAEADLGLAYLLMGDETNGLRWLHTAQQGFEAAGQHEQLVQCLENEAAYLKQAKKNDLAAAVRKRLQTM